MSLKESGSTGHPKHLFKRKNTWTKPNHCWVTLGIQYSRFAYLVQAVCQDHLPFIWVGVGVSSWVWSPMASGERAAKLSAGWLLAETVTWVRSRRCPPGAPCSLRLRFGWTEPSLVSCLGAVEIVTSVKQKLRKIWYFPFRPWLLK